MKSLGLRTYRDKIVWATCEGGSRASAVIAAHGTLQIPTSDRGEQLAWVRQEIAALVVDVKPDTVVLCPTEGTTVSNAVVERAQVDGVVLESLHAVALPAQVRKSATIRASYGCQTKAQLTAALDTIPGLAAIAPTADRREPAAAAVSALPA
ncbi:MAG: hypothetical protein JWN67_4134 [Actinomycetia bacterium]|nr:hypothetical protein [Actinomycetes bacterium]